MTPTQEVVWEANPGPQTRFLATRADEALYGGAAGGGKSAAAIASPLRWVHNPNFRALVLRRDTPQLRDLLDKSARLYGQIGAAFNGTTGTWTFPSGARVWFTHCEHENDVSRFDGHEWVNHTRAPLGNVQVPVVPLNAAPICPYSRADLSSRSRSCGVSRRRTRARKFGL
jgi:hypothetical protein